MYQNLQGGGPDKSSGLKGDKAEIIRLNNSRNEFIELRARAIERKNDTLAASLKDDIARIEEEIREHLKQVESIEPMKKKAQKKGCRTENAPQGR